jgi:protein-tyrosine phosphatase
MQRSLNSSYQRIWVEDLKKTMKEWLETRFYELSEETIVDELEKEFSTNLSENKEYIQEQFRIIHYKMASRERIGEIVNDFLYQGCYKNATSLQLLKEYKIIHVINLEPNLCSNRFPQDFQYFQFDIHEENIGKELDNVIDYLDQIYKKQERVFIHCYNGNSISPSVCIAYLMKVKRRNMKDALLYVKKNVSNLDPNPEVLLKLMKYEEKLFGKGSFDKGSFKLSIKEFGGSYPSLDMSVFESSKTS